MFSAIRHLARLTRIVATLARHDALIGVERAVPASLARLVVRIAGGGASRGRPGERLARALVALGPGFVKLGQGLSIRADLIGDNIAADLAGLQDRLPAAPGSAARAAIEAEFGRPIASLFQRFDDAAVAAASIAQVHFAVTAAGRDVAVKVLRPGVEEAFARDLALFAWLADLVERFWPRARRLKPIEVARAIAETVRIEIDLRLEAAAASELRANFRDDPDLRVPEVEWTLTGRRVLTLERIEGIPVDEVERLRAAGHDPDEVIAKAARSFFKQVFRDGFFHADLHPGNVFVGAKGDLIVVDFGIMGRLDAATRRFLADMLLGFLDGDYAAVAAVHFRAGYVPARQSQAHFTQAVRAIAEPILGRPLAEISLARLLAQLFQVTEQFDMETQPQLLLLQKSMLVCEGVGRALNPSINMWTLARPLIEQWMRDHRGPEARLAEIAGAAIGHAEALPALLGHLEQAAGQWARGGLLLAPETLAALGAGRRGWSWPRLALAFVLGFALAVALGP